MNLVCARARARAHVFGARVRVPDRNVIAVTKKPVQTQSELVALTENNYNVKKVRRTNQNPFQI